MGGRYPFTAIVNQLPVKRALLFSAVNPQIRGVLLRGERGTAKSTAVRGLAEVLPTVDVVADCPYDCPPDDPERMCDVCAGREAEGAELPVEQRAMRVVDLPLNASEDRVVGTIDLEAAVKAGERAFDPGILAQANRNVLYVDEVNLLDDHIVDVLLDAAAMGENVVEREGVSVRHPAEFILVGTMNPEEGGLRPQLLDRFDLVVDVEGATDPEERIRLAERREAFDADPAGFREAYAEDQQELRDRILAARDRLDGVTVSDDLLSDVSLDAIKQRASGVRADIAVNRIARTIAAYEGENAVTGAHVTEAKYFAFPHRVEGPAEMSFGEGALGDQSDSEDDEEAEDDDETEDDDDSAGDGAGGIPIAEEDQSYPVDRTAIDPSKDRQMRERLGRRTPSKVDITSGRYVRSQDREDVDDVALDATLRAAAPHQSQRGDGESGIQIEPRDLRQRIRERSAETLLVFVVDASGSVMSGRQMLETKRGLLSLLEDAYRTRDRVAVVVFRGEGAFTLTGPTRNVTDVRSRVSGLRVGGNTPLADGLIEAYELVTRERRRNDEVYPLTVVFSDGQANIPYREDGDGKQDALEAAALFAADDIPAVWVDTGHKIDKTPDEIWTKRKAERMKRKRLEKNRTFAQTMNADYLPLVTLPRNTSLPDEMEVTTV
jgi:magnesium chelatase subunit D